MLELQQELKMGNVNGFFFSVEFPTQTGRTDRTVSEVARREAATGYVVCPNGSNEIVDAGSDRGLSYLRSVCEERINQKPNGSFGAVFIADHGESVTLMSDPIGTIPLYYASQAGRFVCGTDWLQVAKGSGKSELSIAGFTQIMMFGYALGTTTGIEGVYESPPGAILRFSLNDATGQIEVSEQRYWKNVMTEDCSNEEKFEKRFVEISSSLKERFTKYIIRNHKPVLLKLSAGGDSRFLLGLFHEVPGLMTATWGRRFACDDDIIVAKSLSRQVGVPHYSCRCSGREAIEGQTIRRMSRCTGARAASFIGTGTLTLLKHLPQQEYIHLPGHTGDFISGGHIRDYHLVAGSADEARDAALCQHALPMIYGHFDKPKEMKVLFVRDELATNVVYEFFRQGEERTYWRLLHRFNMENRQRRFILSDSCLSRTNGPVMLPFWDMEIVRFFSTCTLSLLYRQKAYKEFVLQNWLASDKLCRPVVWPINSAPYKTVLRENLTTNSYIRGVLKVFVRRLHRKMERRFTRYRQEWRYLSSCSKRELDSRVETLGRSEPLLEKILTPAGLEFYEQNLKWHLVDVLQVMNQLRLLLSNKL